jgi:uncharacterized membrane protein
MRERKMNMPKTRITAVTVFAGSLLICSLCVIGGPDNSTQPAASAIPATTPASTQASTNPTTMSDAELASKVIEVFTLKCTECHSPFATADDAENARQDITDMTDLEIVRKHVKPGDLKGSALWNAINPDNPSMPPTTATGGKLTDEETEIIRQWIVAGAPLPPADTPDDAAGLK